MSLSIRCDKEKCFGEQAACDQDTIDCPQTNHRAKESALSQVLLATVNQKKRHQGQWQRKQQTFRNLQEPDRRARHGIKAQDCVHESGKDARKKDYKKIPKKTLGQWVDARQDDGEPQSQNAQQQNRAVCEEKEKIVPADHLSAPPVENG